MIAKNVTDAGRLAVEITRLEAKPQSADEDEAADDRRALRKKPAKLEELNDNNDKLQAFLR